MATTCIFSPSELIISPIASAIRPDTPVSISSKMIVGNFDFSARRAFNESITREISPPEAIFSTGCGAMRALAENIKRMRSLPDASNSPASATSTTKRASGIPNCVRLCSILFDIDFAAFSRRAWIFFALFVAFSRSAAIFLCCCSSASSLCVMACNCADRRSCTKRSSSRVCTRCF